LASICSLGGVNTIAGTDCDDSLYNTRHAKANTSLTCSNPESNKRIFASESLAMIGDNVAKRLTLG